MTEKEKIQLANLLVHSGAIRFGNFTTKSGIKSPYFVNLGVINQGDHLTLLGNFYAKTIIKRFATLPTCIFGPAYKAIPLAVATSTSLTQLTKTPISYTFNRKEKKAHGEGGIFVGLEPDKNEEILLIDDVITDGEAKRETINLIQNYSEAKLVGILVCVDRLQPTVGRHSALKNLEIQTKLPASALITIKEIIKFAKLNQSLQQTVLTYINKHTVADREN